MPSNVTMPFKRHHSHKFLLNGAPACQELTSTGFCRKPATHSVLGNGPWAEENGIVSFYCAYHAEKQGRDKFGVAWEDRKEPVPLS